MKRRWFAVLLAAGLLVRQGAAAFAEEDSVIYDSAEENNLLIEEEQEENPTVWTEEGISEENAGGEGVPEETDGSDGSSADLSEDDSTGENAEAATENDIIEESSDSEWDNVIEDGEAEGGSAVEVDSVEEADVVELEDALVVPDGAVSAEGRLRKLMGAFGQEGFDGCFGNQLSGMAALFYQKRVDYYVTKRSTGQLEINFTQDTSPIFFDAVLNSENKIDRTTDEYKEYHTQVVSALQAAGDAFLYDHSEIFWIRGGSYAPAPGKYKDKVTGKYVGYLAKVIYTPNVAFDGADSLISAYDAAVAQTAAQIAAGADRDGDGQTDAMELALAAHDYLCERLYYDNGGLNRYNAYVNEVGSSKGYDDFRIFVSAGGFLDSVGTGVVCEGYARAYKVLCDQFGIPCVLIGGRVVQSGKIIGHMWNGVQINGKWYLTDVTWDDGGAKALYRYFMVGNTLSGRTSSGNFSGSSSGNTFVYPALETEALDRYKKTATTEPTCTEDGYSTYINRIDGTSEQRDFVDALGHDYRVVSAKATCTEPGHIEYICNRCGYSYETEDAALGHAYEKTEIIAPACTEGGYTVYTCSRCGNSYQSDVTEPLGHSYENGRCIRCGVGDSVENTEVSVSPQVYTGQNITPPLTVRFGSNVLTEGRDYTVAYQDNLAAGTARAVITGKGNYTGNKKVSFSIAKKPVTELSYSSVADQVYSGKAKKPAVIVKNGSAVLVKNRDYTISYRNNKKIGRAAITITGKGSYTGTKTITFRINPKPASLKRLKAASGRGMTAVWKSVKNISGYQLQYSTSSTWKNGKTVKVKAGTLTRTIRGLKKGKTYYVRIRTYRKVSGKMYYSTWSAAKRVKIIDTK